MGQEAEIIAQFGHRLRIRVSGICLQEGKILLVKHRYLGQNGFLWAPPGGGMQYGQSATENLQREFEEETGLQIRVGNFLFVNEFLVPPLHAVELFFEVYLTGGVLKKGIDPEMPADRQIIEEVAYRSEAELRRENPLNLHQVFRNIDKLSLILEKNGYHLASH
ncbi:MAG: NUDIX hydrolase [Microscillaceae bacterium]|nr:NUDIX hydrolase [Microscillaceae bacterium]